jgi:hypothetical protein
MMEKKTTADDSVVGNENNKEFLFYLVDMSNLRYKSEILNLKQTDQHGIGLYVYVQSDANHTIYTKMYIQFQNWLFF